MANPSRRSVLRTGVLITAAAAPLAAADKALSVVGGGMASGLRRSTFTPHVGATFRVSAPGGATHRARLAKVADVRTAKKGHDLKFRMLFRMNGAGPGQGTYSFHHPSVGQVHLFVTPIGAKPGVYEAVVDSR
jgi:hypothetical protein